MTLFASAVLRLNKLVNASIVALSRLGIFASVSPTKVHINFGLPNEASLHFLPCLIIRKTYDCFCVSSTKYK